MGVKSALSQEEVKAILSRIEERLVVLGMSKEEFYTKSGISSATYSYWNTNRYKPTPKKLRNAAEVLEVSYEFLVTGEEQNKPATHEERELTEKQLRMWNLIKDMDDQHLEGMEIVARMNSTSLDSFIATAKAFLPKE